MKNSEILNLFLEIACSHGCFFGHYIIKKHDAVKSFSGPNVLKNLFFRFCFCKKNTKISFFEFLSELVLWLCFLALFHKQHPALMPCFSPSMSKSRFIRYFSTGLIMLLLKKGFFFTLRSFCRVNLLSGSKIAWLGVAPKFTILLCAFRWADCWCRKQFRAEKADFSS